MGHSQQTIDTACTPRILEFIGDQPMTRVGRQFVVLASISNPAKNTENFVTRLRTPDGIRIEGTAERPITLAPNEKVTLLWKLIANKPI